MDLLQSVLERVTLAEQPDPADLVFLLRLTDPGQKQRLLDEADLVRHRHVGDSILLRGIVEFSNHCSNTCSYCGLRAENGALGRYRMTAEEILTAVDDIAASGIKTVVLQSGEDHAIGAAWLADVVGRIKSRHEMAVTLSVGERTEADYDLWRQAGADRYLLKIETSDRALYGRLHPGMSLENRLRCSMTLSRLGYENGSGCLVGLPGQTLEHLAADLLFFKRHGFDMVSIGVFIPHGQTPLAGQSAGDLDLAVKMIALARIVTRDAHIPAATALGSIPGGDGQIRALRAGANVVMPNFTPPMYKRMYEIYPNKRCLNESPAEGLRQWEQAALRLGRTLGYVRGGSLKTAAGLNAKWTPVTY